MKTLISIDGTIRRNVRPVAKRAAQFTVGLAGTVALLASLANPAGGTTLANWGFENTGSFLTANNTSPQNLAPDNSFNSSSGEFATITGGANTSTFSSPAGNGSLHSFSGNNWTANQYFQFTVNTVGATGLNISYDQTGSSTGPRDFILQYSTNGTNFVNVGNSYQVLLATWNTTVPNSTVPDTQTYNLSGITSLENNSLDYFRIVDIDTTSINAGTVGTGGTDRVDNFLVTGFTGATGVPEPSTVFGGLLLAGVAFFFWARRVASNGNNDSVNLAD